MIELRLQPLTQEAFAPFGEVIETNGRTPLHINQGFALRFDDLAKIDVASEGGDVKTSIFVAKARPQPLTVTMMERHPLGSQLFYPLQDKLWVVLVCTHPQDPASYRAFLASGQQGVNYARNTWHFPLIVFEDESRFIVVDRKGPGNNLEEVKVTGVSLTITAVGDPFEAFGEWATDADEKAFRDL
jgi:ureidoglycolate lyase